MNIQAVNIFRLNNNNSINRNNAPVQTFRYSNLRPLPYDTVSFSGGEKILSKKGRDIPLSLAKKVAVEAQNDGEHMKQVLKKYLKPLISTSNTPDRPICLGERGIKLRIKGEESIREKATTRGLVTRKEVQKMGDIIGLRIVMRNSSKSNINKVLKQIGAAAKNGDLKIIEIENHYPNPKASYTTEKALSEFGKLAGVEPCAPAITESGYRAIHLTAETKSGYLAEIQIMGKDIEDLKEIEDLCYKIRCNKDVAPKYKPIEDEIKSKMQTMSEKNKASYMQYVRDSYDYAAGAPPQTANSRKKPQYIPIPYFLPPELDFAHLAQMKEACEHIDKLTMKK